MDKAALEEAVRLAADTERMAAADYRREIAELDATGIWDPGKVEGLVRRCRAGRATGMREGMALIGVLSTQLWHRRFVGRPASDYPAESAEPVVRIDRRVAPPAGGA